MVQRDGWENSTQYMRGHKPTPSQESNTLSEVHSTQWGTQYTVRYTVHSEVTVHSDAHSTQGGTQYTVRYTVHSEVQSTQ